jgi:predicted dehydrogenase
MYLRANQKAIGVGNFQAAIGSKPIGRESIARALRQGLSPRHGLEAVRFGYKPPVKPLSAGLIGTGQQGMRLLAAANPKFIMLKAIADIRPSNRGRAAKLVKEAKVYDSWQELIKAAHADGLEAVIIALPSHLHAPAALAAFDAGLHVFVETPLALSVADAKKVARKAKEKNRVLAVGQQRRYSLLYDHALELVGADLLDQVHYIRSQWHVPKPEKKTADADGADAAKTEEDARKFKIDWWQEIAKEEQGLKAEGYSGAEELVHWQLYEKYSGGLLAELGSQLIDAAVLFVKKSPNHDPQRPYPLSVAGSGSQVLRSAAGDIDDHVHCIFEYAIQGYVEAAEIPPKARKKIALQFDMIIGSDFDGRGETVLGRKGSLVLEDEQKAMLYYMADTEKSQHILEKKAAKDGDAKAELSKDGKGDEDSQAYGRLALQGADAGFAAELEHWAFCCTDSKGKANPRGDAEAALYTTVLTVAASKAVKQETRVDFKKEWFDVASDETPDDL